MTSDDTMLRKLLLPQFVVLYNLSLANLQITNKRGHDELFTDIVEEHIISLISAKNEKNSI